MGILIVEHFVLCAFRFLEATVMGMDVHQPARVRISSVRSVFEYCDHLKSTGNTQVLAPFHSHIVDGIINLVPQYSTEVLALALETLEVILKVSGVNLTN